MKLHGRKSLDIAESPEDTGLQSLLPFPKTGKHISSTSRLPLLFFQEQLQVAGNRNLPPIARLRRFEFPASAVIGFVDVEETILPFHVTPFQCVQLARPHPG